MLEVPVLLLSFAVCTVFTSSEFKQSKMDSCQTGDVVRNLCTECVCSSDGYFECKPVDCIKNRALNETIVDSQQSCTPKQMYTENLINCICNNDGTWPHKHCKETFGSLPEKSVKKRTCVPDSYVQIDCNMCKCGPDSKIIPDRCTKNKCENNPSRRSHSDAHKKSNVYSKCLIKNWYSLAPCQFCYCVNENKLVCNTGHNYAKKLDAGQYNLEICGTDMIKEAMELVPAESEQLRESNNGDAETTTTKRNLPAVDENKQDDKDKASDEDSDNDSDDTSDSSDKQDSDSKERKKSADYSNNNVRNGADNLKSKARDYNEEETESSKEDDSKDDFTRNDDSKGDKSNEVTDNLNRGSPAKSNISIDPIQSDKKQHTEDLEFTDNTLKINVPSVLHKMFEMAVRKSMVAISNTKKCTPGSTYMAKCNMCFCLKNGKELCTANKC